MTDTISLKQRSPFAHYAEHLARGELAYQVSAEDGRPVFYPRVAAPGSGATDLQWKQSKGLGTVYATTVMHYKGEAPLNLALIDMDEGFRLMSRVQGIDAQAVRIGMRVRFHAAPAAEGHAPYPLFTPLDGHAADREDVHG